MQERYQLVSDYLDELHQIAGLPPSPETEKQELFLSYRKHTKWIDIFDPQKKSELIGFLLIGVYPNCHPDADYYIEEAYIKPEYRRKKHMFRTVSQFINGHKGIYCLFILNGNHIAEAFWNHVFTHLNYRPYALRDVGAGDEYCTQYGFCPSGLKTSIQE